MALTTRDSEPRLFSGSAPGLRFVVLVALSIVLMVLDQREQHLLRLRSTLAAATYPLQQAVDAPFAAQRWIAENLAARGQLIDENARLRREILLESTRLQRMAALEAENARMRALLDSTPKVGDQVLVAEILSVDMDRLRQRIVLNRGSRDGVFVGQALIDARGVVGQVVRDRGSSSEALLITDPDHALPVESVRNGLRTIAMGTGSLDSLSLPFLTRNADIRPGDLLVSSGLGGSFPAGYPVATVDEVRGDSGEPFLVVSARPEAALERIREVLLVQPPPVEVAAPPSAEPLPAPPDAASRVRAPANQPQQATQATGTAPAAQAGSNRPAAAAAAAAARAPATAPPAPAAADAVATPAPVVQ